MYTYMDMHMYMYSCVCTVHACTCTCNHTYLQMHNKAPQEIGGCGGVGTYTVYSRVAPDPQPPPTNDPPQPH